MCGGGGVGGGGGGDLVMYGRRPPPFASFHFFAKVQNLLLVKLDRTTPAHHPRPPPPPTTQSKTIKHKIKTQCTKKTKKKKRRKIQNQRRTHLVTEIKLKHVGHHGNEPTTVKLQQKSPVLPSSKLALYPSCKWQSHVFVHFLFRENDNKNPKSVAMCAQPSKVQLDLSKVSNLKFYRKYSRSVLKIEQ